MLTSEQKFELLRDLMARDPTAPAEKLLGTLRQIHGFICDDAPPKARIPAGEFIPSTPRVAAESIAPRPPRGNARKTVKSKRWSGQGYPPDGKHATWKPAELAELGRRLSAGEPAAAISITMKRSMRAIYDTWWGGRVPGVDFERGLWPLLVQGVRSKTAA